MRTFKTRVTRLTVVPDWEPIFSEMATHIEIFDEAGGEYIRITQFRDNNSEGVEIEPEEWAAIKNAVETLIATLQPEKP